jgi:flagellar L-ring protein precursor FlgH
MILAAVLAVGAGCATVSYSPPPKEASAPPPPAPPATPASLWMDDGALSRLYSDNRAARVGDIVTIKIVEDAKGSKSATTKIAKDSSFDFSFKGLLKNLFGMLPSALNLFSPDATFKATTSDKYDGNGATTRNDQLTGNITALVMEVFPNGNLRVLGHREVVVNNERQTMEITGIIRPIDVDSKNVVLSTAVADAKISYTGFGVVDDKQNPGWLVRVFNWLSPL